MIRFKRIKVKNFLSVGNAPMGYDFEEGKVYLVHGQNGSGKSCILLDGLNFALYGKAFRNINKDQIVNSINEKDCRVELEFSIGKNNYKIERGIRPGIFNIWVNGKKREREAKKIDYQKFLEKNILRMNEKTFKQIVILGSRAYVPFMQLPAAARRTVIEDLLELSVFSLMGRITGDKLKSLASDYRTKEMEIKNVESLISENEGILEKLKEAKSDLNVQKGQRLEELKQELEGVQGKIEQSKEFLESNASEQLNSDIDEREKFIQKASGVVAHAKSKVKSFEKENFFFEENSICPVCHQGIDDHWKEEMVEKNQSTIEELKQGIEKTHKKTTERKQELKELKEQLKRINETVLDLKSLEYQKQTVEKAIETIEGEIENQSVFDEDNINHYVAKLESLSDNKDVLKESAQEMFQIAKKYKYISEMLKDGGIKTKIIDSYLPAINSLIHSYMKTMESDIDFQFDSKFNETIKSRNRDQFSYGNFSEGEKMRIDLCLLFTWREISRKRNSSATNLMILDEIGDSSLDETGFDALMGILGEEKDNQCTIIISHNPEKISSKCDRVYEYNKVKGFTNLKSMKENTTERVNLT